MDSAQTKTNASACLMQHGRRGVHLTSALHAQADFSNNAPIQFKHLEDPNKELYVEALVNTLLNFSELLLVDSSNGAGRLSEQYHQSLKTVINNLQQCLTKNVSHINSIGESVPKGIPAKKTMVFEETADYFPSQPDLHSILNEEEKLLDLLAIKGEKDHANMTQVLKKVLSYSFQQPEENNDQQVLLYKNLWLEAEASLCSFNCISRFNRVKAQVDKENSQESKEMYKLADKMLNAQSYPNDLANNILPPNDSDDPVSSLAPHSRVIGTTRYADDVMARLSVIKSRTDNYDSMNMKDAIEPKSQVYPDAVSVNSSEFEAQDGASCTMNGLADNIMARFHVLTSRINRSDSMEIMDEIESTSEEESPLPNMVDESVCNDNGGVCRAEEDILARFRIITSQLEKSNPVDDRDVETNLSCLVSTDSEMQLKDKLHSPISMQRSLGADKTRNEDDIEASVMARFHLLKSRADNLSSWNKEETRHIPFPTS